MADSARSSSAYVAIVWLTAIASFGSLLYGIYSTGLLGSETWFPEGMRRFRLYSLSFGAASALFFAFARRYFVPVVAAAAVVSTIVAMSFVPVGSVALFMLSCAVLGRWLFRPSDLALAFLAGLGIWAFAIGVLAELRVHYVTVYLAAHVATLILRRTDTIAIVRSVAQVLRPASLSAGAFWARAFLLYVFFAHWFLTWKPEVGGDALAVHLAIALDFANNHAFTFDFRQYIWALSPMGADYCYAAVAVLGGEFAARLLNFAMVGVVAQLIYRASRAWVPQGIAFLLAALFVCSPMAQLVTGSLMVENFTAAMAIGAGVAMWRFYAVPSGRTLALCALLAGSLVGWKFGGFAIAIPMLPCVAIALRNGWRDMGARPAWKVSLAAALFLVPAAYPYAKALVLTGNPMFPFASDTFPNPYVKEVLVDGRYREPLSFGTLFDLTFRTARYYEGQDGSFGYQYLLLLPLAVVALVRLRSFEEKTAVILGLAGFVAIAAVQPNARYFYPALPFVMVAGAAAIGLVRSLNRKLFVSCIGGCLIAAALNTWFLPTSSWYHREFFLRPLFAERGKLEYLRANAPIRELIPYINRTSGGVLFVENSDIAGVRPPMFSNHWHSLPFRKRVEACRRPSDVRKLVASLGIERFVAPDPPSPEDLQRSPVLYDYLRICTEPEHRSNGFVLLRTVSNCARRIEIAGPQFTTRVFPPGKYDDNDPRVSFLGAWAPGRNFRSAYEHTVSWADERDAEIRFEFEGSAVVLGFTKAFNRGVAEIRIDGAVVDRLDQYAPSVEWQSTKRYAVKPGRHALWLRVAHEKQEASQGHFADLDFFVVEAK